MRRASRKDENQPAIEKRLKRVGCQVIDTSMLKDDTFDMIVLWKGRVYIVEVKNPDTFPKYFFAAPSGDQKEYLEKQLTENELRTKRKCDLSGNQFIITWSADNCIAQMGGLPKPFSN